MKASLQPNASRTISRRRAGTASSLGRSPQRPAHRRPASAQGDGTGEVAAFWERRRPKYLLNGKVVCGVCGSHFHAVDKDYLACGNARRYLCTNTIRVRRGPLQARAAAFTAAWNRLVAEAGAARTARREELAAVERKIANLVDAVADGLRAEGLRERLAGLEARREALRRELAEVPPAVTALHPNLAAVYRDRVAGLERALTAGDAPDALEAARALIGRVVIHPPTEPDGPPGLELLGDLTTMLRAAELRGCHPLSPAVSALFDSSVKTLSW